jgi:polygalacturonase
MVPNGDGLDFTSCSNVIVSDCDIRAGDDAIVVTGYDRHFDLPGFDGIRHPSENVTVTNCTLVSRSSGIRIGGLDQNTMRNYVFSNLTGYEDVVIDGLRGDASPASRDKAPVRLRDGKGGRVRNVRSARER